MSFNSLKEFKKSNFNATQEKIGGKVILPNRLRRAGEDLLAKIEGKVPHGWKYTQRQDRDGTYAIELSRLYVSVAPKNVFGTQISLPTREVELYEVDRRGQKSSGACDAETLPTEVGRIAVFSPEKQTERPAHEIGAVARKAVVNCHELGEKYLFYRAEKPGSEADAGKKRQLLIFSHGVTWPFGRVEMPRDTKFTYYAPHGSNLLVSHNPAHFQRHATYSTHERVPSLSWYRTTDTTRVTTKNGAVIGDNDGASGGTEENLLLTKLGSPLHNVPSKGTRAQHALDNTHEGAAWAACDHDLDVLLVRQHTMPPPFGGGSLKGVLSEINKVGLDDQYDEVLILACRPKDSSSPASSITNNLP